MRSKKIHAWVRMLFRDNRSRFAGIPVDVRRWIIAPMILHPYVIVASNGATYMLRNGERCYIDKLYVGDNMTTFSATPSEWVVGRRDTFTLCGAHGSYFTFTCRGTILCQELQLTARRNGSTLVIGRTKSTECVWRRGNSIDYVSYSITAPEQYHEVVAVGIQFSVLDNFMLWDGARGICICVLTGGSYTVNEITLPWVPVNVFSDHRAAYSATAPWGEIC